MQPIPKINHNNFLEVIEDLKKQIRNGKISASRIYEVSGKSLEIIIEQPESLLKRKFRAAQKSEPGLTWKEFNAREKEKGS